MAGFIKDYDFSISYHPSKANVVADALSQNLVGKLSVVMATQWIMMENIINVNPVCRLNSLMENVKISIELVDRIKIAQAGDDILQGFFTSEEKVPRGRWNQ